VCLGAQLLARAGGGRVYPGAAGPELGWAPVELSGEARSDALLAGPPDRVDVLHWHWDTFDLPPGAVLLASSSRYPNQAFRLGPVAWGLQFHLEVDEVAVAAFLAAFGSDAAAAGTPPGSIATASGPALRRLEPYRARAVAAFALLVAAGGKGAGRAGG
jgi:GMP synthase-like glutamine amidotransferase